MVLHSYNYIKHIYDYKKPGLQDRILVGSSAVRGEPSTTVVIVRAVDPECVSMLRELVREVMT